MAGPKTPTSWVPDGVREHFTAGVGKRGGELHAKWDELLKAYRAKHPDLAKQLDSMAAGELPDGWDKDLPTFPADAKGIASREAGGKAINASPRTIHG